MREHLKIVEEGCEAIDVAVRNIYATLQPQTLPTEEGVDSSLVNSGTQITQFPAERWISVLN